MKLLELIRPDSIDNAARILKSYGYKNINKQETSFASTFARMNDDFILKLFSSKDKGYIVFVNYCLENRGNPNLPVFRGKLMKITDTYYAIRIERLQHVKTEKGFDVIELIEKVFLYGLKYHSFNDNELEFDKRYYDKLKTIDENLADTALDFGIYCNKYKVRNDIHRDNVMLRGNTFVITDPIVLYG